MRKLQQRYWLVIDDINDPVVTPEIRETAYAIAYDVEDVRRPVGGVARVQRVDYRPKLRKVARDNTRFPDAALLAKHFQLVVRADGKSLSRKEAHRCAEAVFSMFPVLERRP